jgi:hypothetical protein
VSATQSALRVYGENWRLCNLPVTVLLHYAKASCSALVNYYCLRQMCYQYSRRSARRTLSTTAAARTSCAVQISAVLQYSNSGKDPLYLYMCMYRHVVYIYNVVYVYTHRIMCTLCECIHKWCTSYIVHTQYSYMHMFYMIYCTHSAHAHIYGIYIVHEVTYT